MTVAVRVHYFWRRNSEVVLEKLPGLGIVTRNRYGSEILNADEVMFLDWDVTVPQMHLPSPRDFLAALRRFIFGPTPAERAALRQLEEKALQSGKVTLEAVLREKITGLDIGVRLYETRNGFRGIVTSSLFHPADEVAQTLMTYLGADRLYVRLCRFQGTFRARLTPKFWRVGITQRPLYKPHIDPKSLEFMRGWVERYESRCAGYATARFITQIGSHASDASILEVIRLHDTRCKVSQNLELA
jgi:hypothetical protein